MAVDPPYKPIYHTFVSYFQVIFKCQNMYALSNPFPFKLLIVSRLRNHSTTVSLTIPLND